MHTWLATGLMGRVIRSRRTLALVAVLAVLHSPFPRHLPSKGRPRHQLHRLLPP